MQLMRTLLRSWRTSVLGQVQRGREASDPVMDVLLSSPSVRMREPSLVAEKVKALVAGGLGHMQVLYFTICLFTINVTATSRGNFSSAFYHIN